MFESIPGRFSKSLKLEFKSFEVGVQILWSRVLKDTQEVSFKATSTLTVDAAGAHYRLYHRAPRVGLP